MSVVWLLRLVVLIIGSASFMKGAGKLSLWAGKRKEAKQFGEERPAFPKSFLFFNVVVPLLSLVILLGLFTAVVEVDPLEKAVVENRWTGQMFVLEPGMHFWPIEPRLWPLVTKATDYSYRDQVIEIGTAPGKDQTLVDTGVCASSASPGQPIVCFQGRGFARPSNDPKHLIELHRRKGPNWADIWVEPVWVTVLKGSQGKKLFDYVQRDRDAFANEVEHALSVELLREGAEWEKHETEEWVIPTLPGVERTEEGGEGPKPAPVRVVTVEYDFDPDDTLIHVSQLAIVDYDYSEATNTYLDTVMQQDFARQEAIVKQQTNREDQIARQIAVDTEYIEKTRRAEANKDAAIFKAEGQAQAKREIADAEAYEIERLFNARAEGIREVQGVLAGSPEYLQYWQTEQWNGMLPETFVGEGNVFKLLDLTPAQR